jgi:hypothetical protein
MADFALENNAFEHAQAIPSRHTCDGEDLAAAALDKRLG